MVIKGKGLRGEQFISLSKQRGKIWAFGASKNSGDFAGERARKGAGSWGGKWFGEAGRAWFLKFTLYVGVESVLCQWT